MDDDALELVQSHSAYTEEMLIKMMKSKSYTDPQEDEDPEPIRRAVKNGFKNLYPSDDRNEHPEKYYVWITQGDEKVRHSHAQKDGMTFPLNSKDEFPGDAPNCRCFALKYIPPHKKTKGYHWPFKLNIKQGQYLKFNGRRLGLYENGKLLRSWNAVSGRERFQDKKYQSVKDKGPLPEGVYALRMRRYQEISVKDVFWGHFSFGAWPGEKEAWGRQRICLDPSLEMDTLGRSGFSIHGGSFPGSAGCIDLTNQMDDFARWFTANNKDVIIKVDYD